MYPSVLVTPFVPNPITYTSPLLIVDGIDINPLNASSVLASSVLGFINDVPVSI